VGTKSKARLSEMLVKIENCTLTGYRWTELGFYSLLIFQERLNESYVSSPEGPLPSDSRFPGLTRFPSPRPLMDAKRS